MTSETMDDGFLTTTNPPPEEQPKQPNEQQPLPLPIRIIATVVRGFGRGSKDLGIPTANLDCHTMQSSTPFDDLPTGIYWGYAKIGSSQNNNNSDAGEIYKSAISIGYNPTYGNTKKTVEPHFIAPRHDPRRYASSTGETLLHDFYDQTCRLSVVGYLRPELPFTGIDALVLAIKDDIQEAERRTDSTDPIPLGEKAWVQSDAAL
jgi:FAD synthase